MILKIEIFPPAGEYIKCIGDARIFSSGGRITRALAEVLENLWSGKLPSYCPSQFKSVMCDKFNMFSGCEQHDAHEFLSMLIDALQQELTHCKQKPQLSNEEDNIFKVDPTLPETEQQQRFSEFVTEKADEKWKQFLTGNNSIVTKLFFGQYLSQLSCPDCLKVSGYRSAFFPYLSNSLFFFVEKSQFRNLQSHVAFDSSQ